MHTNLIIHIQKYIQLQEKDIEAIEHYFEPFSLKNKECILREGQTCKSLCFVVKGCLRMFFNTNKGSEQITQFAMENWWMTDYFGFLDQKKSDYTIQAIEQTEVLSIEFAAYEKLLAEAPILERYFRIMAQRAVAASQMRLKLIFDLSKEDMYLHFNSSFPYFTQRIPQYMLASFLGITPEYLSELRKKHT